MRDSGDASGIQPIRSDTFRPGPPSGRPLDQRLGSEPTDAAIARADIGRRSSSKPSAENWGSAVIRRSFQMTPRHRADHAADMRRQGALGYRSAIAAIAKRSPMKLISTPVAAVR